MSLEDRNHARNNITAGSLDRYPVNLRIFTGQGNIFLDRNLIRLLRENSIVPNKQPVYENTFDSMSDNMSDMESMGSGKLKN